MEAAGRLGLALPLAEGLLGQARAQSASPNPSPFPQVPVVWPEVVVQLHAAGSAYIVDTRTDSLVATLPTGKGATLGSTTPDGKKVYVSNAGEGETEVVVIDLEAKRVAKRIATGNRPKHGLVSPDGRLVGVNHWGLDGGKLRHTFIRTQDDTIVRVVDLEVSGTPRGVTSMHNAWSLDSRLFFAVDRVDNRLVVIDTQDWSVRTFAVPSAPHYPVPSPDGRELWLVHEGNESVKPGVIVYDLTRPEMPVVARMELPLIGEDAVEAHHGNFSQDGRYFFVTNRGPGSKLAGREVAVFSAAEKRLVYRTTCASTGVGHVYNSPDGRYAVVTNYGNNVLSILDIEQMKVVKDLVIGSGRMGHVAFTPDGRYFYASNDKDGNLFKVDLWRMRVVKEIRTANAPGGGQVLNVWTNVFEELPRS